MIKIYEEELHGGIGDWNTQIQFRIKNVTGYSTEKMLFNPNLQKTAKLHHLGI